MGAAETAIDLLMACHERMHRYVGGVEQLVDLPDSERARTAAAQCARYFRAGLPLHGADEDESLAPRLRELGLTDDEEAALERMEAEHEELHRGLPGLIAALEARSAGRPVELASHAAWIGPLLRGHMELEERSLFPRIAELSADERAEIVHEIRGRRHAQP